MMMRHKSGEFLSFDLLGHDVGELVARDPLGRHGKEEVVKRKVTNRHATRGVHVDGVVVVTTSTFLECHYHVQGYEN
ncbi:hypothetical protein DEO72_LG5g2020 [Vigna unguiculata]|uniref:Uncharacterized protein n=1 Tax=Vigna unguiculata TaxID=3917 RepID=A0A4D6LZM6_VIGUN|nr:hypothetical protein DEO72_LG5g2020 [Vigna unguiculata]